MRCISLFAIMWQLLLNESILRKMIFSLDFIRGRSLNGSIRTEMKFTEQNLVRPFIPNFCTILVRWYALHTQTVVFQTNQQQLAVWWVWKKYHPTSIIIITTTTTLSATAWRLLCPWILQPWLNSPSHMLMWTWRLPTLWRLRLSPRGVHSQFRQQSAEIFFRKMRFHAEVWQILIETWCEYHAAAGFPVIIQFINSANVESLQTREVGITVAPFKAGSWKFYGDRYVK